MTKRHGVFVLALLAAAASASSGDSVLAIPGGTGKYAGASGQMKLHARDAKGAAYDFVHELQ